MFYKRFVRGMCLILMLMLLIHAQENSHAVMSFIIGEADVLR